jgi:leucyl-tRNA synthetase
MGTKLPWDEEWIIESLSDSVIYMSYYTIVKHINEGDIKAEQLNDEVFSYILLGKGNCEKVARSVGLDKKILKDMRKEFTYFYPLDSRNSGRDLVPNHLTFFIFNHSVLFPKDLWPQQIVVTGSVLMEGKKMSKSLGNIIPLREAIANYGADPFRLTILSTSELLQDADFSDRLAKSVRERLERFYNFSIDVIKNGCDYKKNSLTTIDMWLLSRLQLRIKTITDAMNSFRIREAIHEALYMLDQDIQWYMRRKSTETSMKRKKVISKVLWDVLQTRILLLAPFTPHLCEEIWHKMGNTSFISTATWPIYDDAKVDKRVIEQEAFVKTIQGDTMNIIQATKLKPKTINYYTCSNWKWKVYLNALELAKKGILRIDKLMKKVLLNPEMRKRGKQLSKFINSIIQSINKMPVESINKHLANGKLEEFKSISDARKFFKKIFNAEVKVFTEDDLTRFDPKDKARLAEPYRPAIYIE